MAESTARVMRLACPECHSTDLRSVEQVYQHRKGHFIRNTDDGAPEFVYDEDDAGTVFWETADSTGDYHCVECFLDWPESDLVELPEGE